MFCDIMTFVFALLGIISLFIYIIFKLTVWQMDEFTITLPLIGCDKSIYNKVCNIRSFCDFCGIKKKCTVVLINYGAPEWFCEEILNYYENYDFLKIHSYKDEFIM